MLISQIKVGMLLDMCCQSNMDYIDKARVEAVAYDWFVVRDEKGRPWFIDDGIWDLWEGVTQNENPNNHNSRSCFVWPCLCL